MRYVNSLFSVLLVLILNTAAVGQTANQELTKPQNRSVAKAPNAKAPNAKAPNAKAQDNSQEQQVESVVSDEMKADINKLIRLNGELNNRLAALINAFAVYKSRIPGVKKEFWEECDKLFTREIVAEQLIPVYAQHYTHDEIKGMITFFESPVGNTFVRTFAKINNESNAKLQKLSMKLGSTVDKKLEDAGYAR